MSVKQERLVGTFYPSLSGIPNFILYAAIGVALSFIFTVIYVRITGHDEIRLIREGNASAALALGSSLVAFAMPLSKAIAQASSVPDCILWGAIALIIQLLAYGLARTLIPGLSDKISKNTLATAIILAAISLTAGMLNSASMTYYPTVGGVIEAL
jgi:putative membrane protein